MPGIINTTPTGLCKTIIGCVLTNFLPPGIGAVKGILINFIFNTFQKHAASPKTYFNKLGDEEKALISRYVITIKKTFQELGNGIEVLDSFKITIMDKKIATEWIKFFDNFKVKTD